MQVLVCHSVLGLRDVEHHAADRLRGAGHEVSVPDLFGGAIAASIDEGAEIVASMGWPAVCEAAERALKRLPKTTVLMGFSMGVGVASELWLNHPLATGAVFLHALPTIPQSAYSGFPFQVHVGEDDIAFADLAAIEELHRVSRTKHLLAEVFRYPNASHFFTDSGLPDYDSLATSLTWKRILDYLARLNSGDRD